MRKKQILNIYKLIIPILIIGISLGYTTFPVALVLLLPIFFMTSRHTLAIFLVMYGGSLGGVVRSVYPVLPVYGLLMELVGLLLMWDLIQDMVRHHAKAIGSLLLTLAFFGVFYLLGPRDSFAHSKYISMCTHGLFMLFGYYTFSRSKKIDTEGLTMILLMTSICFTAFVIQSAAMTRGDLIDYNWFRSQCETYEYLNRDFTGLLIGYQQVGMMALFALTIYLSQANLHKWKTVFYVLCCLQVILMSGTRQAILGAAIVMVLRFVFLRVSAQGGKNIIGRWIQIIAGVAVAALAIGFFMQMVSSDVIDRTLESGDNGRMMIFAQAIAIFSDYPLTGAGIGGFHAIADVPWPHNMVLELLCETGILGTLAAVLLLAVPLSSRHIKFRYVTPGGLFYFLILAAIFIRVMVSSDFRESIELFSAVFAIASASGATSSVRKPSYSRA